MDDHLDASASLPPHLSIALLHDQTASHSNLGLVNAMSVNASAILVWQQRHTIQVIATATASVSITAASCAIYWFCMMKRNFRRDLVLLLITGDFWKSLWYLSYSAATFVNGPLTKSKFCQASGFMLQVGLESCDMAILLMSLHMYLQIFPPANSFLGHDGLYRARYAVVAAWLTLPILSACLAFVNTGPAYEATGAFCLLPIRPYWYRLALSWIPRYLIWFFITAVAIRIYRHVGKEFRVFGHERDASSSMAMPGESSVDRAQMKVMTGRRKSMAATMMTDPEKQALDDEVAPDDIVPSPPRRPSTVPSTLSMDSARHSPPKSTASVRSLPFVSSRRPSAPNWSAAFNCSADPLAAPVSWKSQPASRRGSRQIAVGVQAEDFQPPSAADLARHRGSTITMASVRTSTARSIDGYPATLAPIKEDKRNSASTGSSSTAQNAAAGVMQVRRRAIQRQLRLLFIYPVVYMMIWIIPFIYHCFNYSDYYAQNPIFALSALNTFCLCFLGCADVSIFCWREKPWRHVPGSDGTFLGSFCFWSFWKEHAEWARRESRLPSGVLTADEEAHAETEEKSQSQTGLLGAIKRWSMSLASNSPRPSDGSIAPSTAGPRAKSIAHRRTRSGGSDRNQLESERAHQRLALERADWERNRKGLDGRRASVVSEMQHFPVGQAEGGRKEWWDRHVEEDGLGPEEQVVGDDEVEGEV